MHFVPWKNLCKHKSLVGLGFRSTYHTNMALPAKQAWRIVSANANSLVGKTLQVKYLDFILKGDCKPRNRFSWVMKDVLKVSFLIANNLKWQIGDGTMIPLDHVKWFPLQNDSANHNVTVANLIYKEQAFWNEQLLSSLYSRRIKEEMHHRQCSSLCPFYKDQEESSDHIFLSCDFARAVSFASTFFFFFRSSDVDNIKVFISC
ncbi:uncharacterized protein LOC129296926 [Prosopis cineraria]|uniref:uncharacterized protein LOC129296926 n=1 Tax=Prosopis cineraria TaxID=364024 RepID=UPI00240FAEB2|nr:uncharacterized protein LOC129296926 [Prosopis cineraria]